MIKKDSKIYIAGHRGLVGSAIFENLKNKGYKNIVVRTRSQLDLTDQRTTHEFFNKEKPEFVFLAAGKVGGILANNTYRADFIYQNSMIQNNIIHESYLNNVKKLLFLGSTCIYPKLANQPIKEDSLLTSTLEYTNEPYAVAKIAGIKMCESYNLQYNTNFISVMPTNLYGPRDNFDLETSHVLPALLRKIHLAKLLSENKKDDIVKDLNLNSFSEVKPLLKKYGINEGSVEIWGTGKPTREFLWSQDMADACVFVMENVDFKDLVKGKHEIRNTHINIGSGDEISIKDLALLIGKEVGFSGKFLFNEEKPDGTLRKVTDVTKLNKLGWKHSVNLENGIHKLYSWYKYKSGIDD